MGRAGVSLWGGGDARRVGGTPSGRCQSSPLLRSACTRSLQDPTGCKCDTVWPNHSCCGNYNPTFPAFHLACLGGICHNKQTAAPVTGARGKAVALDLHGGLWGAMPSRLQDTTEKGLGGMPYRPPSAHARPSESSCWPGTETLLRQGTRTACGGTYAAVVRARLLILGSFSG